MTIDCPLCGEPARASIGPLHPQRDDYTVEVRQHARVHLTDVDGERWAFFHYGTVSD